MHGRVTHNHDTYDDVADDAGQEDDHVDYGYLEKGRGVVVRIKFGRIIRASAYDYFCSPSTQFILATQQLLRFSY